MKELEEQKKAKEEELELKKKLREQNYIKFLRD